MTMTVDEAIKIAKEHCPDDIARQYLDAAKEAIELDGEHAFKVQILYALSNMGYLRGPVAREVKVVLKRYANSKD
jgi:hypothetical protein